jgi:UPF0716 protein FxsA
VRGPLIALLILAFPLAEIAGFIFVGRQIGVLPTIGLIITTAIAGSLLLRFQGMGVIRRIRQEMQSGGDPSRDMAHGVMIVIAGILLLIPGFLTDIVGILLFIPPIRDLGWRFVRSRITVTTFGGGFGPGAKRRGNIIELDEDDYTITRPQKGQGPRIEDDR